MLPNQELGKANLNIAICRLLVRSRTGNHLPGQGERQEHKKDEVFKRARRFHAAHLAQSLRPSKPA